MRAFKTVNAIKMAAIQDLEKVVGRSKAQLIVNYFGSM